ncbi:MAG: hypothetical protein OEV40_08155 [Acidimicrobiia bacterium]|nr:hypothetical protein [Acidimicrobiia bacterium]
MPNPASRWPISSSEQTPSTPSPDAYFLEIDDGVDAYRDGEFGGSRTDDTA